MIDRAAFLAIMLIGVVVIFGGIVHFVLERRVDRKINRLQQPFHGYRFECTCGWVGYRGWANPPTSIKCPRCNGVAPQLNGQRPDLL